MTAYSSLTIDGVAERGTPAQARRIDVYLVPLALAERFGLAPQPGRPPKLRGMFFVGHPHADAYSHGKLVFRVPATARTAAATCE